MKTIENTIRKRLAAGQVALGAVIQTASPEVIEMLGLSGYDFAVIDTEHGTIDLATLVHMIRAADAVGISAVVRVPDHTPSFIMRVLDAGAAGVLMPHLCTRADAEALVSAVKYAPLGERGACPATRATGHFAVDWPDFARRTNEQTLAWGLVEDMEGVENINEIAAVPGLDAVMFGNFDLAQSKGLPGQLQHPVIQELFFRVKAALQARGVELIGLTAYEPGGRPAALERGAKIVIDGSDRGLISAGFRRMVQELREVFRND